MNRSTNSFWALLSYIHGVNIQQMRKNTQTKFTNNKQGMESVLDLANSTKEISNGSISCYNDFTAKRNVCVRQSNAYVADAPSLPSKCRKKLFLFQSMKT